jgi:pimeloyl-ACP methyl ester carboxylesterase
MATLLSMATEIRTERVRANDLEFEVHTCGSGDRLALFLHGFPEHAHSWRHQMPALAELGYRVWAPCLRGYGSSDRPKRTRDYHIDHLKADVAGLIDASGAKETVLIAHDWGGAIAWAFAIEQVRPLSRLIVMNMPHPKIFLRALFRWPQMRRSWYVGFFQLPWLPELALGARKAKAIGNTFYSMAIDKSRFPREVTDFYSEQARAPGALTAMLSYYRANFRGKRPRYSNVIETPTLLLWGEEDAALGKELTIGTDELVRDLTVRYLPGVSHWVQQEAPETVNAMMTAWLRGEPVPEAAVTPSPPETP